MLLSCFIHIKTKTQKDKTVSKEINYIPELSTRILIKKQTNKQNVKHSSSYNSRCLACKQQLPDMWRSKMSLNQNGTHTDVERTQVLELAFVITVITTLLYILESLLEIWGV